MTAVWGGEFIQLFLDVCVPNQLSAGNLPALPAGSRYRIFTTAGDLPQLTAGGPLDDVRRLMPVDLVAIDMSEADQRSGRTGTVANAHKRMIACHRRAAAEAAEVRHGIIFLTPDLVLDDRGLETLVRLHRGGARAVVTTGIRLSLEAFVEAQRATGAPPALPARQLVAAALDSLHPTTESLMAEGSSDYRTAVYWPIRAGARLDGVLIRTFTLHPVLIDPVLRQQLPGGPVDSHYVRHCVPDIRDVHVVADSDELALFELTTSRRTIGKERAGGALVPRLVAGSSQWDAHQRVYWQRSIRIHAAELDERWQAADAAAVQLASTVERYRPVAPILVVMYRGFKFWRRRQDAYATVVRKLRRRGARVARVTPQRLQKTVQDARKALRPAVTRKQIARPVKLMWHRAAKASRQQLKRLRRRMRTPRTA